MKRPAPTPERWQQIGRLFDEALGLPAPLRPAFLTKACAGDDALQAAVERLLADADGADTYFDDLAQQVVGTPSPEGVEGLGSEIGPYRAVQLLGRGGMGAVYLAERIDGQFEQQVALKIIKRGMDTEAVLQRFLRERQILARLQHPGIARLLDGGATPDGRPYFVLAYVKGEPITTYCDRRRLSIDERLRLFLAVGEAVHYAHRNLVVHRDLKPSNILVTDSGEVKLLDFGIAKLLGAEAEHQEALTQTGMAVMTPAYAAPEQVRGDPVTTATDIYALGLLLGELLTGHLVSPEAPMQRPSVLVTQPGPVGGTSPEAISRARSTETRQLRRRLAGDLDRICLMALRDEPERRYASAEAFVQDIRRHLAGLPVRAQPDTVSYRLWTFVRRHRTAVGLGATAVLALLVGLGAALWQSRVAAQERDRARLEAATAEQVSAFLVDLFDVSDPFSTAPLRGDTVTALTILERSAARLRDELAHQPVLRTALQAKIGQVYTNLGQFEAAEALHREVLAERRRLLGDEHPEVANSMADLAVVLNERGVYEEAETLHRAALALRKQLPVVDSVLVAESMNGLADAVGEQARYEEAEALYREALALRQRLFAPDHPEIAESLNNVGWVLGQQARYADAERYHREALERREQAVGAQHPFVASSLNNVGWTLVQQGHYAEAETYHRRALALRRQILPPDHLDIAQSLASVGSVLREQGRPAEAIPFYEDALAVIDAALGKQNPFYAITLNNLGWALYDQRQNRAAIASFHAAEALARSLFGAAHPAIVAPRLGQALALVNQGRFKQAETVARDALAISREVSGEGDPRTAHAQVALGLCLAGQQRHEEAEVLLLDGYAVLRAARGEAHRTTLQAQAGLYDLYNTTGRPAVAERYRPSAASSDES